MLDYTPTDAFRLFLYWLHTGRVHTLHHTRDDVWSLIVHAYKFANNYKIHAFANDVIDLFFRITSM
jgi:hypothetical protein